MKEACTELTWQHVAQNGIKGLLLVVIFIALLYFLFKVSEKILDN